MNCNPKEKIHVHIHHAPYEDSPNTKHDCLGCAELTPGDALGGELAGGFFYVGMAEDGDILIAFVNTCFPENIKLGGIGESAQEGGQ